MIVITAEGDLRAKLFSFRQQTWAAPCTMSHAGLHVRRRGQCSVYMYTFILDISPVQRQWILS